MEATSNHFVFVQNPQGKKEAVPAGTLKVGNILYGPDGAQEVITNIRSVTRDGIYAPFTPSGTIIVDGIEASSYASLLTGKGAIASSKPYMFQKTKCSTLA